METERKNHGLIKYNDVVFAFGGIEGLYRRGKMAEKYEIDNDQWSSIPDLPQAHDRGVICVRVSNNIFLFDEAWLYRFNPETYVYDEIRRNES